MRSLSEPDKDERDKRRNRKTEIETKIMEVEAMLLSMPSTDPGWDGLVRELHALHARLEQVNQEKPTYVYESTPYRIISN